MEQSDQVRCRAKMRLPSAGLRYKTCGKGSLNLLVRGVGFCSGTSFTIQTVSGIEWMRRLSVSQSGMSLNCCFATFVPGKRMSDMFAVAPAFEWRPKVYSNLSSACSKKTCAPTTVLRRARGDHLQMKLVFLKVVSCRWVGKFGSLTVTMATTSSDEMWDGISGWISAVAIACGSMWCVECCKLGLSGRVAWWLGKCRMIAGASLLVSPPGVFACCDNSLSRSLSTNTTHSRMVFQPPHMVKTSCYVHLVCVAISR
jgi:hypothetical protein